MHSDFSHYRSTAGNPSANKGLRTSPERALQIAVASTAALSSALLGWVQNNLTLSLVAGLASLAALLVTDLFRIFSLNQVASTILAIVALATTLFRVELGATEDRLVSISDLLVYLQLILQFQSKNARLYWQILTLSLLEIVVAAALNLGVSFSLFLVLYLTLAVVSLVLLNIRVLADWEIELSRESVRKQSARQNSIAELRPLLGHDAMGLMVNRSLTWQIFRLIGLTLILAIFVFFAIPRVSRKNANDSLFASARQAGFSHSVSLTQSSQITDSQDVVMRVQFSKWGAQEPYLLSGEPYFHGTVLTRYEALQGRWQQRRGRRREFWQELSTEAPPSADVRERVILEPGVAEAFSVFPVYGITSEPFPLRQAIGRDALIRSGERYPSRSDGSRYDIRTSCFRHGMPRSIRPVVDPYLEANPELLSGVVQECLEFNELVLPVTKRIATSILESRRIDPDRRVEAALCLESYLRRSEDFKYSRERKLPPPYGIDPIEHFLSDEKWGHCEFFASTLAMMLRSQGIPARLVIGYRGGEFNGFGQYYSVTQSNAHAWVEAYLRPEDISEHSLREGESAELGGWLRLDPTPAADQQQAVAATEGWMWHLKAIQDYLQHLWKDYVLGLNSQRQRQLIYRPLVETTSAGFRGTVLNLHWWKMFRQTLVEYLGLRSFESFRDHWFHWKSVPLLMGVFLFFLLTRRLWRSLQSRLSPFLHRVVPWRWYRRVHASRSEQFLRKWEGMLARRAWRRHPAQTVQEFAQQIRADFLSDPYLANCAPLIETWACHFYRARYADPSAGDDVWEILDKTQRQLEQAMTIGRKKYARSAASAARP